MKIAICDDERSLTENLKSHLYEYANLRKIDLAVETYSSGESLLDSAIDFQIIFLDYQMGGIDGLETAKILRDRHMLCKIIFLTNYPDFIYESFEVGPFRFHRKPVTQEIVFKVMDAYFAQFGNDYPLQLRCNRENVTVSTSAIISIQADKKRCILHMADKSEPLVCTRLLGDVEKQLPKTHFFRTTRDFVVNFHYIEKYNSEYVFLKNGTDIPLSRKYARPFKEAYRGYTGRQSP